MSQQINLLAHEVRPPTLSALRSLIVVGLLLPPIIAYAAYAWLTTTRLADTVAANDVGIAAEKSRQKALQDKISSRVAPANDSAEIDALKPLAGQSQEILGLLRGNANKASEGYSDYLTLLARLTSDGLWLTTVKIANAGKSVSLAGHSMRKETVLGYVQRLNEQFARHGVRFTSLELAPESGKESATGTPLSSVTFKLN